MIRSRNSTYRRKVLLIMGKQILICDDAAFMRMMLKDILVKEGYEVVGEAVNGADGVEKYNSLKPDLVTMDITMPNMNGMESLKEILYMDKNAKVVMISAAGQQKKIVEAIKLGAKRFITKPFEKDDVISCMDSLLKAKQEQK